MIMLIKKLTININRQPVFFGNLIKQSWLHTSKQTSSSNEDDYENVKRAPRKLKKWREDFVAEESVLKMFTAPPAKEKKLMLPRNYIMPEADNMRSWFKKKARDMNKEDQRFVMQRHRTLGCDLATAHFLVHREGKVKFSNKRDWIIQEKNGKYDLPMVYDEDWKLTHIDASNIQLYYEGIENFQNLVRVVWANFSNNILFDDWCTDKLSANIPNLEYLNISGCKRVTERSLEAIYKFTKLNTLVITDWHKQPSFELSCLMLEDCCPNLSIKLKDPPEQKKRDFHEYINS